LRGSITQDDCAMVARLHEIGGSDPASHAGLQHPHPEAGLDLSVVIPIFNEQDSLTLLHQRLSEVLGGLDRSYEVIFVDDGSTDRSVRICRELAAADDHTVIVELRRHFGKATALQAGFEVARGAVIITMDGDLQDDPKEIPAFLSALSEDVDLVSGWKRNRQDPLTKTVPSRIFNAVTSFVSGISLRDFNCGFKAYRAEVVRQLDLYGEIYRFIPVLAHSKGYHVAEIPVEHQPRRFGASKYSFERFLRGAFDLLTVTFLCRFQRRPLHLFGVVGMFFMLVGLAIDTYMTVLWLAGATTLSNRPLLLFGTLLIIVGVQVLVFGLLAEMITAATYRRSDVLDMIRQVHRASAAERAPGPSRRRTTRTDDVVRVTAPQP
jgi:glycosyltransferase involved in cell wall biosynthesis